MDSGVGVLFAGVFDGHDGEECSEYCRVGILPHIAKNYKRRVQGTEGGGVNVGGSEGGGGGGDDKDESFEILKASMIEAFHEAQDSFEKFQDAPLLGGAKNAGNKTTARPPSFLSRLLRCQCGPVKRRGGTTVNCLVVQSLDDGEGVRVVVANCGDSRCITDGGTGSLDVGGKLGKGRIASGSHCRCFGTSLIVVAALLRPHPPSQPYRRVQKCQRGSQARREQ